MLFDFETFSSVVRRVFPSNGYSLQEALTVFRYYFLRYEEYAGHAHPPIRASQIARIIQDMPYICEEDRGNSYLAISPDAYFAMIDQHFSTKYRKSDFNINHFFSGRIRELRFYETCF